MLYHYLAKDAQGRTVSGTIESDDQTSAAHQIRAQGHFPMSITTGGASRSAASPVQRSQASYIPGLADSPAPARINRRLGTRFQRLSKVEMAYTYRQLASLANAGISPDRSFELIAAQSNNTAFRQCFTEMRAIVVNGTPISTAMLCYPRVFPEFTQTLVKAGELTGDLTSVYNRIAESIDQEMAIRRLMISETVFPCLTLACAFLLPPLVLLVVNHQPLQYFREAVLPIIEIVGGAFIASVLVEEFSQWRIGYDTLLASIPGFSGCARSLAVGRFARTLAALYSAGVMLPTAVALSAKSCGNKFIGNGLINAAYSLEQGMPIIESLTNTRMLPPMVIGMLGTAEETGNLDSLMNKVAEYFEAEAKLKIHRLAVIFGVLVLLFVGYRVLMVLISFYTGYYNKLLSL